MDAGGGAEQEGFSAGAEDNDVPVWSDWGKTAGVVLEVDALTTQQKDFLTLGNFSLYV